MTSVYKQHLETAIAQADVLKVFDNLLTLAVEEGFADIHIEPFADHSRMRVRKHGVLEELLNYPKPFHETLIAKFKVESGQMRPDERRLPQDAILSSVTITGKEIELFATTLPTVRGEKLVLRIVDKSKTALPIDALGIEGAMKTVIMNNIKKPYGIIFIAGPWGSGKSSTLYSFLDHLKSDGVSILSYENPIEIKIPGITQSQIRADIGYTFSQALKSALKHDPDSIAVSELHDSETLDIMLNAAMSGHLLLSTIDAPSSLDAVVKLLSFARDPSVLASSLTMILAQRLVKTLCPICVRPVELAKTYPVLRGYAREFLATIDKEMLKKEIVLRGITQEQRTAFAAEGKGLTSTGKDAASGAVCGSCQGRGSIGRIGIYGLLDCGPSIKTMIANRDISPAWKMPLINLELDGLLKVVKGSTSLENLYAIVKHAHSV